MEKEFDKIALQNADVVARLKEEIKKLQDELIKNGTQMSDLKRRNVSLKLIDYNRILKGDKPIDNK